MRGRIRGMLGLILVAVGVGASCDWTDWRDKRPLTFELGARAKNFVLDVTLGTKVDVDVGPGCKPPAWEWPVVILRDGSRGLDPYR